MSINKQGKLIIILGPTASGKSDFAVRLGKKFDSEIISADSRQIYKSLDIGSNKITKAEKQGIKHYAIDIVNPDQNFSLHDWQQSAFKLIKKIFKNKKLAMLVGGTGLYLSSILQNYELPATDKKLRAKLNKLDLKQLVTKLVKQDPDGAKKINLQNKVHVARALEYAIAHKENFKDAQKSSDCPYDYLIFGLKQDTEKLYAKINKRVDQMIGKGLVDEVKNIYQKYPDKNMPALSGIGYQEIIQYLENQSSLEEAIELIKKNTRHYAKRQMTWFRRMEKQGFEILWNKDIDQASKLITKFLAK
ncbi:tRNA (adenosine(37)-N6)-dimethylallyltransferase MiaA [bacterium]|jgi:tRNA dimethylallyltransferase|nr:tRNA (adenosine(37)-N6)-dimethylallyltransferase MiaA [bacterium]MBT4649314.1 tRNA (adenosine(37)-N6)-dimethylallyltransferase MiaA [bacterium]MBT7553616.1 tRNA (adenosine(37)-N6)-dimethylallyltransferase MiaA [bacterium]